MLLCKIFLFVCVASNTCFYGWLLALCVLYTCLWQRVNLRRYGGGSWRTKKIFLEE